LKWTNKLLKVIILKYIGDITSARDKYKCQNEFQLVSQFDSQGLSWVG